MSKEWKEFLLLVIRGWKQTIGLLEKYLKDVDTDNTKSG